MIFFPPGKVSIKEDIVLPKHLIPWSVYCTPENLSLDALTVSYMRGPMLPWRPKGGD